MACTSCSRSATASPSSDRLVTVPTGRVSVKVLSGTFAQSVSVRAVDVDDMPDLTKTVLTDAGEARIITRQAQAANHPVHVTFSSIDYQTFDATLCKAYQGKSIVDPDGWTPVPTADLIKETGTLRVIGAKIMLANGNLVVLTSP